MVDTQSKDKNKNLIKAALYLFLSDSKEIIDSHTEHVTKMIIDLKFLVPEMKIIYVSQATGFVSVVHAILEIVPWIVPYQE